MSEKIPQEDVDMLQHTSLYMWEIATKLNQDMDVINSQRIIVPKEIADELKSKGIEIDKRKIINNEPVTSLGYSNIKVELYKGVIATIKVKLVEE